MVTMKIIDNINEIRKILLGIEDYEIYIQKNYSSSLNDNFKIPFDNLIIGLEYLKLWKGAEVEIGYFENITRKYKLNMDICFNKHDRIIIVYSINSYYKDKEYIELFNYLIHNHNKLFNKNIFIPLGIYSDTDFFDYIKVYFNKLFLVFSKLNVFNIIDYVLGTTKLKLMPKYTKLFNSINNGEKTTFEIDMFNIDDLKDTIKEIYDIYFFCIRKVFRNNIGMKIELKSGTKIIPVIALFKEYNHLGNNYLKNTTSLELIKYDIKNML